MNGIGVYLGEFDRVSEILEPYKEIVPTLKSITNLEISWLTSLLSHYGSIQTPWVSIYLGVENNGRKRIAIAKTGSKSDNCSVSVLKQVSRSYFIVMLQVLINVLKKPGRHMLNFTFFSDTTCFLRFLKEDMQSTNELYFNTRLQLKEIYSSWVRRF